MPDAAKATADKWTGGTHVQSILTPRRRLQRVDPERRQLQRHRHQLLDQGRPDHQFNIEDPVPYSDYWNDAGLISQELQAAGIDATTMGDNPDYRLVHPLPDAGDFQSMIHWGAGGPTPFVQYQNWLDSTLPVRR